MKNKTCPILLIILSIALTSCTVWNKVFPAKYGCDSNGKNTGAEKIIEGGKVPKTKKFRA